MSKTDQFDTDPELKMIWNQIWEQIEASEELYAKPEDVQRLSQEDRAKLIFNGLLAPRLPDKRGNWKDWICGSLPQLNTMAVSFLFVIVVLLKTMDTQYQKWFLLPSIVIALLYVCISSAWSKRSEKKWRSRAEFLLWQLAELKWRSYNNLV